MDVNRLNPPLAAFLSPAFQTHATEARPDLEHATARTHDDIPIGLATARRNAGTPRPCC